MKVLLDLCMRFSGLISKLQFLFLLVVRLYWGWQFAQSGWGKLHHLDKVTDFFTSLNLSDPGKFYFADPYTFLFASAMVLVFGAGFFSLDALLVTRWNAGIEK
jgi:putative oxidoreductase